MSLSKGLFGKSGDLYVGVYVDDLYVFKTNVCFKSWSPSWGQSSCIVISLHSKIQLKVFNFFKYCPDALVATATFEISQVLAQNNGICK